MKRGCGTHFWLQFLCRHCRLPSPMVLLSPKGFTGLPAFLPLAILHVIFLTNRFCWLHWYTGYTIRAHLIYQRLATILDAYQPWTRLVTLVTASAAEKEHGYRLRKTR